MGMISELNISDDEVFNVLDLDHSTTKALGSDGIPPTRCKSGGNVEGWFDDLVKTK